MNLDLEVNAYEQNHSIQTIETPSIGSYNKVVEYKHNSMDTSEPKKTKKPASNYLYSLHHKEYDYSIISKNARRISNKGRNMN